MDQRGHRRRAFHRVRQPDVERNLRRLAGRADEQQQRRDATAIAERRLRRQRRHRPRRCPGSRACRTARRAQHAEDEPVVADAVDDERLLAGVGRRLLLEPEADQQVRAEADAFPADEHHQEVRAEHEHEHERGEQVQIREVARELAVGLVVHVGGRVDVDQRADAGDDQDHHRRQRIEPEREARRRSRPTRSRCRRVCSMARRRPTMPRELPDRRQPTTANDASIAAQAQAAGHRLGRRRPSVALTRKPSERKQRNQQPASSPSPFQRREGVGVQRLAWRNSAMTMRQADRRFGGRHRHHEERR